MSIKPYGSLSGRIYGNMISLLSDMQTKLPQTKLFNFLKVDLWI